MPRRTINFDELVCASVIRELAQPNGWTVQEFRPVAGGSPVHTVSVPDLLYVPELHLQLVHGHIVPEEAIHGAWSLNFEIERDFEGRGIRYRNPFETTYSDQEVCILSNFYSINFAHWIGEELIKVTILESAGFTGCYVLSGLPKFAFDFMQLLGIAADRLIDGVTMPTVYRSAVLTTPITDEEALFYPDLYLELRATILAAAKTADRPGLSSRIWMDRGVDVHNKGRDLVNRDEVYSLLERYGIQVVDMAKLPLPTQIAASHNAEMLTGPHGAAYMHTLFMKPKSLVVECFSPEFINPSVFQICRLMRHKYNMVVHGNAYGAYPYGNLLKVDCSHLDLVLQGLFGTPGEAGYRQAILPDGHSCAAPAAQIADVIDPGAAVAHALQANGQKDWKEAVRRWEAVRRKFPDEPLGYVCAAQALRVLNRLDEAERLLIQAMRRFPRDLGPAMIEHACVAQDSRDWPEAIRRWEAVRRHSPDHMPAYAIGALALAEDGRFAEAEALVEDAIRRFPPHWLPLKISAELQAMQGNWPQLVSRLADARRRLPDHAEFAERLFLASQRLSKAELAQADPEGMPHRPFTHLESSELSGDRQLLIAGQNTVAHNCLVFTNFEKLNPAAGRNHVEHVYASRGWHIPPVELVRLAPSAQLAVPNEENILPVFQESVLIDQLTPGFGDQHIQYALDACSKQGSIAEPAIVIGRFGSRTWGHWLLELLPKVVAAENFRPDYFRYILPARFLSDPVYKTALQSLEYYGVGAHRLALVADGTLYTGPELHIVTPAWAGTQEGADDLMMINPAAATLMRTKAATETDSAGRPDKIALLRRKTATRRIANQPEIETVLRDRGWAIIDIEDYDFARQVEVFRHARSIVSVSGSGLAGLLYAQTGVGVMSLGPAEWSEPYFYPLMQERSARFVDIRGTSTADRPDNAQTAGFRVDPAEMEAGLKALELSAVG